MGDSLSNAMIITLSIGVFCLVRAMRIKMGYKKRVFLRESGAYAKNGPYALFPFALGNIGIAISAFVGILIKDPYHQFVNALTVISFVFATILSFAFMLTKPAIVKPQWLIWLEAHYPQEMICFMFAQARRKPEVWEKCLETQAGLEVWAEDLAQKYEARHERFGVGH